MEEEFLNNIKKQFEYYKILGEKTFSQIDDKDLFWQFDNESNSIAIIVNHLWGNMKSRWTNLLNADGEKEWRKRDLEFENIINSRKELITKWNEGWECLFLALNSINKENFKKEIFIRNQSHPILEAINRQYAHYIYHVGQIVYIGKMVKSDKWQSLSIPKGKSSDYNKQKFSRGRHFGHFTNAVK